MNIEIYTEDSTAGPETSHFASTCADFELGSYSGQIAFARVYIAGPRLAVEGKQPSCQVEVAFIGGEVISERTVDNDLHIAIFRTLERASETVAHRTQYTAAPVQALPAGELLNHEQPASLYFESDRIA